MVLKSIGCAAGSWATAGAAEGGGGVDMDADCGWAGSVLRGAVDAACGWAGSVWRGAVDAACGWAGSLATGAGEDGARLDAVDAGFGWAGSLATGAGEDGARLDRVVVIVGRGSDDAQRRIIRLRL